MPKAVIREIRDVVDLSNAQAPVGLSVGGVGAPVFARARLLLRSRGIALYAVPTTTGAVCVTYMPLNAGAECFVGLVDMATWRIAAFACRDVSLVAGGLVSNDVDKVEVRVGQRQLHAVVGGNAFLYVAPPQSGFKIDDVTALGIHQRSGHQEWVQLH